MSIFRRPTGNTQADQFQFSVQSEVSRLSKAPGGLQGTSVTVSATTVLTRIPDTDGASGAVVIAVSAPANVYVVSQRGALFVGSNVNVTATLLVM